MNVTFDKDSEEPSGSEEVDDMPVKKLDYEDEDSDDSDQAGGPASLPMESASLGAPKTEPKIKKTNGTKPATKKPKFIDMIVEAITEIGDKKGATVPALKTYLREKHGVTEVVMKTNLKKAIAKGEENEVLIRPNASKDSKGLTGRFKVNPGYLKTKQKSEKMKKQRNKQQTSNKPRKKKAPAAAVNRKDLKSLQEKSLAVKLAKEKIKQARKSIGLTPNTKPKVAPKKRVSQKKPLQKRATPSKSPRKAAKKKPKPKTTKAAKGAAKKESSGKGKKAPAVKKTVKAK